MAVGSGTLIGSFTTSASTTSFLLNSVLKSNNSIGFTGWIDNLQIGAQNSGVVINLNTMAVTGGDATGDLISNFQNVIGTVANDTIIGNAANNSIFGGLGFNSIDGGAGNDYINVEFWSAGGIFLGGDGNDTIIASVGNDTVNGGRGNDSITVYNNGDIIQFDWSLQNGQGWGQDTIEQIEVGYDKIVIRNLGFTITSQSDFDELFSLTTYNAATPFSSSNPQMVTLKGIAALGDFQTIAVNNFVYGTAIGFSDFQFVKDPNVTWMVGTSSANTLTGTAANDTILGLAGDDTLTAFAGNDILDGGSGNDSLDGGDGDDTLISSAGVDRLFGGNGNDILIMDVAKLTNGSYADGGAGNDVFQLAPSASVINTSMTLTQLNTLLDNTETLDFTSTNNKVSLSIDLSNASADRTALSGIAAGGAVTIRYNATGANDIDAITVSNAAGSDSSGTMGASGYTQNFYADAAKTQLLLTLIAA